MNGIIAIGNKDFMSPDDCANQQFSFLIAQLAEFFTRQRGILENQKADQLDGAPQKINHLRCARNIHKVENGLCLLYTSDAADDLLCVDLGGRRIIKKTN